MLFERRFGLVGLVSCQKLEHDSITSNILLSLQDGPLSMAGFWNCMTFLQGNDISSELGKIQTNDVNCHD